MAFQAAAFERFTRTLEVNVHGMNERAARAAMAEVARMTLREILDEQRARAGVVPAHEHAVDGRLHAPYESVRPDGSIVFGFDYVREIATVGLRELEAGSPRDSGAYAASHFMLIDGRPGTPEQIVPDSVVTLTNDRPYSRRLEVGVKKDGTPFVIDVPPHIYEREQKSLRRRYGEVASIEFTYIDLDNAYVTRTSNQEHYQLKKKRRRAGFGEFGDVPNLVRQRRWKAGVAVRYPAIVIRRR